MKRLVMSFAACFLLIGATACSTTTEEPQKVTADNQDSTENKSEDSTSKDSKDKKDKIFHIGESIKLGDRVLTVTKIERSNGTEMDKPDQGKVYVVVSVKIKNKGEENISYNPFNYKLKNSKGQITDTTISLVSQDTQLNSGELAPGGKVTGTLVFSAPKNDKNKDLTLILQPNFLMEGNKIKVNLTKK